MFDLPEDRSSGVTLDPAVQRWYEFDNLAVPDQIRFVLPLRPGDRLLEWRVFLRDDAGPPIDRLQAQIGEVDPSAGWAFSLIGLIAVSDGSGTDQSIGDDLRAAPHVVLAERPVDMVIDPDASGALAAANTLRIYPFVRIWWDHP